MVNQCTTTTTIVIIIIVVIITIIRVYNYVINEDGQPMYLGSRTSVLFYNKTIPSWVW